MLQQRFCLVPDDNPETRMCGIAGIFHDRGTVSAGNVRDMLAAVSHRGPDDRGIACFDTRGRTPDRILSSDLEDRLPDSGDFDLALGHVRLSILDLSAAGHQPMGTQDGKFWITYNGEIFNYPEIKRDLEARGYSFRSATDTEALLYAYREYGESCLERLRGFFSFCVYDAKAKQLFLARDRLGLKPLKYYWDGQRFAFASEIKALLQLQWISRTADLEAIDQYLSYRYIPAPLTGVRNIYKLPPGCCMTLSLRSSKGPDIRRYWLPQFEPKSDVRYDEAREKTAQLLGDAIRIRLLSDVPLGIFLSGGIDSNSVVGLLRRQFNGEIQTFSVGFADSRFDERPYAARVAALYDTHHTELVVEPRPTEDLRKIIWHFDEPFGDPSAIPSYYLSQAAAGHVKVILNGDGGDELFAGYKRYRIHARNRFLDYVPDMARRIPSRLLQRLPFGIDKKRGWGRVSRILESSAGDMIETYPLRFSGFSHSMRKELYKGNTALNASENGWPERIRTLLGKIRVAHAAERLMALDQITYLPEDILAKSDCAGMAHSIENRSPLLDHLFVEWANHLPFEYKTGKKLLKDLLRRELPADILGRKKAGFNPPLAGWMRTSLRPSFEEFVLSENSSLKSLNKHLVREMFDAHQSGMSNLGEPLWLLLVLAVWLDINDISMLK
jgi:asparagine synthase (glutamine-hydrolysing)